MIDKKLLLENIRSIRKMIQLIFGTDNNPNVIGTVRQVIENETGLKVYVVESPDKSLRYTISKSVHDIFVK